MTMTSMTTRLRCSRINHIRCSTTTGGSRQTCRPLPHLPWQPRSLRCKSLNNILLSAKTISSRISHRTSRRISCRWSPLGMKALRNLLVSSRRKCLSLKPRLLRLSCSRSHSHSHSRKLSALLTHRLTQAPTLVRTTDVTYGLSHRRNSRSTRGKAISRHHPPAPRRLIWLCAIRRLVLTGATGSTPARANPAILSFHGRMI